MPALQNLYDKLSQKGFVVVAIGVDDTESALREFQTRFGLTFPILVDSTGTVRSRFRLGGVPESFVLDKDGKLVMFADPESNEPAVRIIGPREWGSQQMVARLEQLISAAPKP